MVQLLFLKPRNQNCNKNNLSATVLKSCLTGIFVAELYNSKMSANKHPVLVDIGSVQSKNLKLVTFNPIGELIPLDENLTLRYRISKSFHPKSGDWIGLFQVSHDSTEKYMYIGFHWAQKHPYEKKKPLERLVHVRINEFSIPVSVNHHLHLRLLFTKQYLCFICLVY